MQKTDQAQPAPAVPGAPEAPAAPAAPRSVTITGADGKTTTISLSGGGAALAGTDIAPPAPPSNDEFAQGAALGVSMTLLTLGIFALYNRFRRRSMKKESAQLSADSTERFDRLERGVEAIAIEVERISEGQRFVTKMMSDSRVPVIASEKTAG